MAIFNSFLYVYQAGQPEFDPKFDPSPGRSLAPGASPCRFCTPAPCGWPTGNRKAAYIGFLIVPIYYINGIGIQYTPILGYQYALYMVLYIMFIDVFLAPIYIKRFWGLLSIGFTVGYHIYFAQLIFWGGTMARQQIEGRRHTPWCRQCLLGAYTRWPLRWSNIAKLLQGVHQVVLRCLWWWSKTIHGLLN